jgi:hypothetical protein
MQNRFSVYIVNCSGMDIVKSLQLFVRFFFFVQHNRIYKSLLPGFAFNRTINSKLVPKEENNPCNQKSSVAERRTCSKIPPTFVAGFRTASKGSNNIGESFQNRLHEPHGLLADRRTTAKGSLVCWQMIVLPRTVPSFVGR